MSDPRWPSALADARLHVVSGKGGTGKTTLAAALALALAAGGRRTLLVEVEGRQGIAQLFDTPPLPYAEQRIAVAPDGGEVRGLSVDAEAALLEYLEMFYNLGLAGRTLRRMGAIEFATTLAPGLRDVLLSGKVKECVGRTVGEGRRGGRRVPLYDAVVLDAPPTGRIVKFLDVTKAMGTLARTGPIHTQSEGVVELLHSSQTAIHLVTQLEDLPVQETLDTVAEIADAGLPPGAVLVNRIRPSRLPAKALAAAGAGLDAGGLRSGLEAAGLFLKDDEVDGLVAETDEYAERVRTEDAVRSRLDAAGMPQLDLPELAEGVDLGGVYELAELLREQGALMADRDRLAGTRDGQTGGRPRHLDLDTLLDDRATRVLVCCGSGGVGKTTTAAALALRAAQRGRRVVVLTIDPARRLAQSLGLEELDNEPRTVPGALPEGAGTSTGDPGELQAMMLDMRRTFDEMVAGHTTPDRAQAIFDNPFYQTISTSFSGTQEYMAMEKLGQLTAAGTWDLVVVDTPPSRSALDFLDAPQRLSSFLDGRMIRLLSAPARAGGRGLRRIVGTSFTLFAKAVSTILGGQMLADASAFVQAFDTLFGGFQERANRTYRLLRAPGTSFVVVAAPEPDALREASYFVDRLSAEQMPLAGLVLNRTHPVHATLSGARAREGAENLEAARGGRDTDPTHLAAAVLRLHADRVETAERERRVLGRFTRAHPGVPIVDVPAMATDVHDLDGLREIGRRLAS